MPKNVAWAATRYILIEVLLDIVYFPVWWYTKGLAKLVRFFARSLSNMASSLSLKIWLRHMFTPMYGQYDWQGRMISFMMRFVMLIYKTVVFVIWIILLICLLIFWIAAPIIIVYFVLYQLFDIKLPFEVDIPFLKR